MNGYGSSIEMFTFDGENVFLCSVRWQRQRLSSARMMVAVRRPLDLG